MSFFTRGKSTNTNNNERRQQQSHNQQNTVPFSSRQPGNSRLHEVSHQQHAQPQYYPGYIQVSHNHHPHQHASTQDLSRIRRVSFAPNPPTSHGGYVRQRHISQGHSSHADASNLRHFLAAEREAHSSDSRSIIAEPSRSPRGSMTSMSSGVVSARHHAEHRQLRGNRQERSHGSQPAPAPRQQQLQAVAFRDLNRDQQQLVRAQLRQVPVPHGFNGVDMLLGRRLPPGSGMPISTANFSGVLNGTGVNANFYSADLRNARFGPFQ